MTEGSSGNGLGPGPGWFNRPLNIRSLDEIRGPVLCERPDCPIDDQRQGEKGEGTEGSDGNYCVDTAKNVTFVDPPVSYVLITQDNLDTMLETQSDFNKRLTNLENLLGNIINPSHNNADGMAESILILDAGTTLSFPSSANENSQCGPSNFCQGVVEMGNQQPIPPNITPAECSDSGTLEILSLQNTNESVNESACSMSESIPSSSAGSSTLDTWSSQNISEAEGAASATNGSIQVCSPAEESSTDRNDIDCNHTLTKQKESQLPVKVRRKKIHSCERCHIIYKNKGNLLRHMRVCKNTYRRD